MKTLRITAAGLLFSIMLPIHAIGATLTIGIPLPQAQLGQGSSAADVGESIRQNLTGRLRGSSLEVVPLEARDFAHADSEAAQKHLTYVLYTRAELKRGGSGGLGGMLHKLSAFTNAGPGTNTGPSTSAGIKSGDTVTIEYRLMAPGSTSPVGSATFQGKAGSDGEDVLSPLIDQVASSVISAAASQGSAAAPGSPAPDQPAGRHSLFGGLLRRHDNQAPANAGVSSSGGGQDCGKIVAASHGTISADTCEKMMSSRQTYDKAAADPGAARSGDEALSCEQITAELRQQTYTAPDKATAAELKSSSDKEQAMLAKQRSELAATAAAQQVAINAAAASDLATEAASGGVANPHKAAAVEQTFITENRATSERMAEERRPTETRMVNSTADLGSDMASQLSANPRLARLIQLANAKHCKGS